MVELPKRLRDAGLHQRRWPERLCSDGIVIVMANTHKRTNLPAESGKCEAKARSFKFTPRGSPSHRQPTRSIVLTRY